MLNAAGNLTWPEFGVLLAILLLAGFAISWLATDILRIPRDVYIALLALITAGGVAITVAMAEVGVHELLWHHWQVGIVGGVLTGLVVGAAIRKFPATLRRSGHALRRAEAWEGVVYGISEGLLLSGLPAFAAWQVAADEGWNDAAGWALALAASAVMIAVHHFGYWDFRNRQVVPVIGGCLLLTVGYLATGSLLAPALGHVLMHVSGVAKGVELPPHDHVAATG